MDFVVDKLNKGKIPYYRLNCEDIDEQKYLVSISEGFRVALRGITNFTSVWFRRIKLPNISEDIDPAKREYLLGEYYALIQNLLPVLDVKWLSFPPNVYSAENKLLQLKRATEVGFQVPDTIITNDKTSLRHFFNSSSSGVIIKPLSQNKIVTEDSKQTIFTNRLTIDQVQRLDEFSLTPAILQKWIDKKYELRITVVGEDVFCAAVNPWLDGNKVIDWRKHQQLKFRKYDLPPEISLKCISLVKSLGLSFGAIDMIKSESDQYYFLEINPNGQWGWLETEAMLPISDAIIKYLVT